jgi:Flp pilus assembly protein TadD
LDPHSSPKESSLGQAYAALGKQELAVSHLEKAMQLDPLNLSAAFVLIKLYDANGRAAKASVLAGKIAELIQH